MAGVEELYKQFGILADANEKAGEVNLKINFQSNRTWRRFRHVEVKSNRLSSFYAIKWT